MIRSLIHRRTTHTLARVLVRAYRQHLSPMTGLACAHRVHHGGQSCSALFEARLLNAEKDFALSDALSDVGQQLSACAASNRTLRADGIRRDGDGRIIIPCVPFI